MNIKNKIARGYADVQGGLFSSVEKADVGDVVSRLGARGIDIMAWADPFFPDPSIPEHILEAYLNALKTGFPAHYTMPIGNTQLKEAMAKKITKDCGIDVDPNRNLLVTPGSDSGLLFAMSIFVDYEDEVLVHSPSYPSNFLNPKILGGKTVVVPTYAEDNYRLNIDEFKKRLTSKTKMVLLTNPNNPTGTSYTKENLEELAKFIIENDLVAVVDQAFEDVVFDGHEMVTMASIEGMWERTITTYSVSKGMVLSGFRVGFLMADDHIMDILYGSAVNFIGATNTAAQLAVIEAFKDLSFMEGYRQKHMRRAKYAYEAFNSVENVSMDLMESGFFSWVNVSKLDSSANIVNYLMESAKVMVNDGKNMANMGMDIYV